MLKTLNQLSILKTLWINIKMFPLKEAIRLPIFIGKHTKFISLKGKIQIDNPIKTGMIRVGFSYVGVVDYRYSRTLIELNGKIIFQRKAFLGNGSKISVGSSGVLEIGNKFQISANSTIICFDSIIFDENVLLSWDITIMDTDFHKTINTITNIVNERISKPIKIGKNSWIGIGSLILKGTVIPANTIVGASSLLNKSYDINENSLLAGNPAVLMLSNIRRES